ncbi:fungal-specific transcription factor domain-containing protein [Lipomyces japonicus]|uniref:fungal-specific transcription factor domain-containing protein n=1 Tax=Lipomyces japonicus TaxID=56871 RepID=UPI0034CED504
MQLATQQLSPAEAPPPPVSTSASSTPGTTSVVIDNQSRSPSTLSSASITVPLQSGKNSNASSVLISQAPLESPALASSNEPSVSSSGPLPTPPVSSGNGTLSRPFYTRNRRERPCDSCRKRKTRCIRTDGSSVCTICISHDEVCTFILEPPTRRRNLNNHTNTTLGNGPVSSNGGFAKIPTSASPSLARSNSFPQPSLKVENDAMSQLHSHHQILSHQQLIDHQIIDSSIPFVQHNSLEDRSGSAHPSAKRARLNEPAGSDSEQNFDDRSDIMDPSSNAASLGMNDHSYSELVGPNLLDHEYKFVHRLSIAAGDSLSLSKNNYLRPVSNDAIFLMTIDRELEDDHKLVDEIETIVRPYGPQLVSLYFKIVHPSYPIIHKTYFLSQYKISPKQISPPLLAAVYSLALNWWAYDHELSHSKAPPDSSRLETIAYTAIQLHLHRARLATVQAGLLLLQRKPDTTSGGFGSGKTQVSAFTAQLVGVGQALGLHLDCSNWQIPSWEIPLRRRVAWALYVQDRWVSLCHGRPCFIDEKNWLVTSLTISDFCIELSSASGVDHGAELLIEMSRLTSILSDILHTFFFAEYTKYKHEIRDVVFELAKPLQLKLRQWHAGLSDCLYMKPTNVVSKRLCTTGYLHLAYYTVEITLHKAILRALEGCSDPVTTHQFRTAANDRARAAVTFVQSLSAEYIEAFWLHSSRDCLIEIGQFIALLEATSSTDEESKIYDDYREGYSWHLRVHSRAAWMFEYALLRLETIIWPTFAGVPAAHSGLEGGLHYNHPQQHHVLSKTQHNQNQSTPNIDVHGFNSPVYNSHSQGGIPSQHAPQPLSNSHGHAIIHPDHVVQQNVGVGGEFWSSPVSNDEHGTNGNGLNNVSLGGNNDRNILYDDVTSIGNGSMANMNGMLYDHGYPPVGNMNNMNSINNTNNINNV